MQCGFTHAFISIYREPGKHHGCYVALNFEKTLISRASLFSFFSIQPAVEKNREMGYAHAI